MTFPSLIPSSRRFRPSQWPVARQKFMTGDKQSTLFASRAYRAELQLSYANRTPSEVALFMAHYDQLKGTYESFVFPSDWADSVWGGWSRATADERILAINGRWRYASPPRISQQKGKTATIQITLLQVPGGLPAPPEPEPEVNSCGWTCVRIRLLDGFENLDFYERYADGSRSYSFNYVKDNPEKWCLGQLPLSYLKTEIDGITYKWAQQYFSYQLLPDYLLSNCFNETGTPDAQLITPSCPTNVVDGRYGRDDPRSEFNTSELRHTVITNNFNRRINDMLWPVYYLQTEPPWLAPPQIFVSTSFPTQQVFYAIAKEGSSSNDTIQGSTYMPGFRYQLWIPDIADFQNGQPTMIDENGDRQWSDKGKWIDVDENWNNGSWGGNNSCLDDQTRSLPPKEAFQVSSPTSTARDPGTPITSPISGPGTFPNYTPSRRSISYGEWNTKVSNPGKSNQRVTLPLPSTAIKTDVILELVYANRPDAVARDFLDHYLDSVGVWNNFTLPTEKLKEGPMAGWAIEDGERYLSDGYWSYNRPPQITSVHPGTSTITTQLIWMGIKPDLCKPQS